MNIEYIYKNKYITGVIIIILITLFLILRNDSNTPTFKTTTVTYGDIKSFIQATGKIEPTRKAEISSEVPGIMQSELMSSALGANK